MQRGNTLLREQAFVREYVKNGHNGTQAVLNCGVFKPKNINVASSMAAELLRRPRVQALIEVALQKKNAWLESRYQLSADRVIRELAYVGFSRINDYISVQDDGDAFVDLSKLNDEEQGEALGAAVQKIESETYYEHDPEDPDNPRAVKRTKFALHPKLPALLELGKVTGDPRFQRDNSGSNNTVLIAQQMQVTINQLDKLLFPDDKEKKQ